MEGGLGSALCSVTAPYSVDLSSNCRLCTLLMTSAFLTAVAEAQIPGGSVQAVWPTCP